MTVKEMDKIKAAAPHPKGHDKEKPTRKVRDDRGIKALEELRPC